MFHIRRQPRTIFALSQQSGTGLVQAGPSARRAPSTQLREAPFRWGYASKMTRGCPGCSDDFLPDTWCPARSLLDVVARARRGSSTVCLVKRLHDLVGFLFSPVLAKSLSIAMLPEESPDFVVQDSTRNLHPTYSRTVSQVPSFVLSLGWSVTHLGSPASV